jgi:8-oxo-dGTP diphosphatase
MNTNTATIQVTAAVILDEQSRVFITQRHSDDAMGGKWEFPGGKIEPGETLEACLQRELQEELGILVEVHELFTVSRHTYPALSIELFAYRVSVLFGQMTLHAHQDCQWVALTDLHSFDFLAADLPIVEKLVHDV